MQKEPPSMQNTSSPICSGGLQARLFAFVIPMLIGVLVGAGFVWLQKQVSSKLHTQNLVGNQENANQKKIEEAISRGLSKDMGDAKTNLASAERSKKFDLKQSFGLYNQSLDFCDSAIRKLREPALRIYSTRARAALGLADLAVQRQAKIQNDFDQSVKDHNTKRFVETQNAYVVEKQIEQNELNRAMADAAEGVSIAFMLMPHCDSEKLFEEIKFASWLMRRTNGVKAAVTYLNGQIAYVEQINKESSILPGLYEILGDIKKAEHNKQHG